MDFYDLFRQLFFGCPKSCDNLPGFSQEMDFGGLSVPQI